MTHAQMRQLLVEQSGMRGLVTDADGADYSNKSGLLTNATYYLNAGLRWLNRRWTMRGVENCHILTLTQGQYQFDVPYSDFITRIDAEDAEGARIRLKQVTLDYLRDLYPEPFDEVEQGSPLYWARTVKTAPGGRELIIDPNFTYDPLSGDRQWATIEDAEATDLTYNIAQRTMDWAGDGSVTAAHFVTDATVHIDLTKYTYTITYQMDEIDVGDTPQMRVKFIPADGTIYAVDPSHFPVTDGVQVQRDLGSLTVTVSATQTDIPPGDYYVWISNGQTAQSMRLTHFSIKETRAAGFLLMPPADGARTVYAFGDYSTADLVLDADENWWTVNHPELVCRASRINIGVDAFRSASELEFFTASIETELERIVANDQHAKFSAMTPTEFCTNG